MHLMNSSVFYLVVKRVFGPPEVPLMFEGVLPAMNDLIHFMEHEILFKIDLL